MSFNFVVDDDYPYQWVSTVFTAANYNKYVRQNLFDMNINVKCFYCGSKSPDDERGNCSACGAPRA